MTDSSTWRDVPGVGLQYTPSTEDLVDEQTRVRVCTAAAMPACTRTGNEIVADANGALNDTGIDGVTDLAVGDWYLDKDNATQANRGVWELVSIGTATAKWRSKRAPGWDTSDQVKAMRELVVSEGTANGNHVVHLTTNDPITLNSTSLVFAVGPELTDIKTAAQLALTTTPGGASYVGVFDNDSHYTSTTVEAVLKELMDRLKATDATGLAAILGILDTAALITAANVEAALAEFAAGGLTTTSPIHIVRGASTADVASLAAFTVANDGITFVAGERVLLKNQATATQNGIYVVGTVGGGTAPLTRAADFTAAAQIKPNTVVAVSEGTANADTFWHVSTNAPITVGATNLAFAEIPTAARMLAATGAAAGSITDTLGLVTATTIEGSIAESASGGHPLVAPTHLVRGCSTADVPALATFTVAAVDGLTYIEGERILLRHQTAPEQNGIYTVGVVGGGTAALTRAHDFEDTTQIKPGVEVAVSEGTAGLNTRWQLTTNSPITVGVTGLVFAEVLTATRAALATGSATGAIADAGAVYTVDTIEAALQEVKLEADAFTSVQSRTLRIVTDDLTDAVNGHAQVFNIGADLPTNAIIIGAEVNVGTLFSGGAISAVTLDIGGTDADAIADGMDVFTGAATGALAPNPAGIHRAGNFSAQQLTATLTPDAGHPLVDSTAGDMTITVWFTVATALQSASLTVAHGDLTAAAGSESIAFAAALPAGAVIVAHEFNVTALFTDGAGCTSDVDLGISAGDTDRIENGLNTTLATGATGRQYGTAGIQPQGLYDGSTLAVTVNASVNVDTLTAGSVTGTVWYFVP